ncbi:unnamed protein product [Pieris macdunnoughi]|uniref:Uncharacterized protein n=1 Tax=Pieris macdunnoughi TaxID=345717 RepID=A0A821WXQ8_9NEOP|nr:unnamed protein product [Pieris macdunnoughi]
MELKFIWFFFVASCFVQGLVAQENDVTEIPSEIEARIEDVIEGSGNAGIEEKHDSTKMLIMPQMEPIIAPVDSEDEEEMRKNESPTLIGQDEQENNSSSGRVNLENNESLSHTNPPIIDEEKQEENSSQEIPCPKPCLCSIEGEENNLVVNCAGYSLTEFPSPIDTRTTTLNLNNNKLTEIPRDISSLKNLKILNANDNSIMELAAGSISELPELITLKLAGNRLIEYPQDLKNSISLNKLEELDLGGNDIRTTLTPQLFSSLKSLRKVTLPSTSSDLVEDLCRSFKASLETVCTETCKKQSYDCPDVTDLFGAALPGMISFDNNEEASLNKGTKETTSSPSTTPDTTTVLTTTTIPENSSSATEFSLRAAVNEAPISHKTLNTLVEAPTDTHEEETEVKIGAKTSEITKAGGGVDRSVIGIVIASMIVVVAVIAIKKNWTSIKKRFGSAPRPNDRTPTINGTTPEEIPLQEKTNDKLPV